MTIHESYHEVLDVLDRLFVQMFEVRCEWVDILSGQTSLRLTFCHHPVVSWFDWRQLLAGRVAASLHASGIY